MVQKDCANSVPLPGSKYITSGATDAESFLHAVKLIWFQVPKTTALPKPGNSRDRFSSGLSLPTGNKATISQWLVPYGLRLMTSLSPQLLQNYPTFRSICCNELVHQFHFTLVLGRKNPTSYVPQCLEKQETERERNTGTAKFFQFGLGFFAITCYPTCTADSRICPVTLAERPMQVMGNYLAR